MLQPLVAHLAVDHSGRGRPRTRPEAVIGEKAYASRAIRADLRSQGKTRVVLQNLRPKPEPTGMGSGVWPNMRWR
jgi:hypothetical protein